MQIQTGAVLWDLDGTLIDSGEEHWLAWQSTMANHGLPITRAQYDVTFGRRNQDFLADWLGADADPTQIAHVGITKEARYRAAVLAGRVVLLPGARHWLETLHAAGWQQALATSAPQVNALAILEVLGIGDLFGAVVCAEDVSRGKPDPEVFLTAAARLNTPAARCIVVEDADAGVAGAHAAGMRAIGVGTSGAARAADLWIERLDLLAPDSFTRLLA